MNMRKGGFTIIEVALFLAITGLLFLGITVGVQNSIFQQRFNDSVQSFADFLKNIYSEVTNVQGESVNGGNTDKAIYGKLVTFGEDEVNDTVYVYNVVGKAKANSFGTGTAKKMLESIGADVVNSSDGNLYGVIQSYKPKWSAEIQNTKSEVQLFKGALLIVRHPRSGRVFTYSKQDDTIKVQEKIGYGAKQILVGDVLNGFSNDKDVNFCINPNGRQKSNSRADVRIEKGARNSSGIEIIMDEGLNGTKNECRG